MKVAFLEGRHTLPAAGPADVQRFVFYKLFTKTRAVFCIYIYFANIKTDRPRLHNLNLAVTLVLLPWMYSPVGQCEPI